MDTAFRANSSPSYGESSSVNGTRLRSSMLASATPRTMTMWMTAGQLGVDHRCSAGWGNDCLGADASSEVLWRVLRPRTDMRPAYPGATAVLGKQRSCCGEPQATAVNRHSDTSCSTAKIGLFRSPGQPGPRSAGPDLEPAGDPRAELLDVADHPDGAATAAQLVQDGHHRVERLRIQRPEALVDEERVDPHATALRGD